MKKMYDQISNMIVNVPKELTKDADADDREKWKKIIQEGKTISAKTEEEAVRKLNRELANPKGYGTKVKKYRDSYYHKYILAETWKGRSVGSTIGVGFSLAPNKDTTRFTITRGNSKGYGGQDAKRVKARDGKMISSAALSQMDPKEYCIYYYRFEQYAHGATGADRDARIYVKNENSGWATSAEARAAASSMGLKNYTKKGKKDEGYGSIGAEQATVKIVKVSTPIDTRFFTFQKPRVFTADSKVKDSSNLSLKIVYIEPIDNLADNGFSGVAVIEKDGKVLKRQGFNGNTEAEVKTKMNKWYKELNGTKDARELGPAFSDLFNGMGERELEAYIQTCIKNGSAKGLPPRERGLWRAQVTLGNKILKEKRSKTKDAEVERTITFGTTKAKNKWLLDNLGKIKVISENFQQFEGGEWVIKYAKIEGTKDSNFTVSVLNNLELAKKAEVKQLAWRWMDRAQELIDAENSKQSWTSPEVKRMQEKLEQTKSFVSKKFTKTKDAETIKVTRAVISKANAITQKYSKGYIEPKELQNMYKELSAIGIETGLISNGNQKSEWYYNGKEVENSYFIYQVHKGQSSKNEYNIYFN